MKKINLGVRFSKDNLSFIVRFVGALLVPILIYMGLEVKDLTSWPALWTVFAQAVSNPYIVGLTVINAINLIPDPTTKGLGDSNQALEYTKPKEDGGDE